MLTTYNQGSGKIVLLTKRGCLSTWSKYFTRNSELRDEGNKDRTGN